MECLSNISHIPQFTFYIKPSRILNIYNAIQLHKCYDVSSNTYNSINQALNNYKNSNNAHYTVKHTILNMFN